MVGICKGAAHSEALVSGCKTEPANKLYGVVEGGVASGKH